MSDLPRERPRLRNNPGQCNHAKLVALLKLRGRRETNAREETERVVPNRNVAYRVDNANLGQTLKVTGKIPCLNYRLRLQSD